MKRFDGMAIYHNYVALAMGAYLFRTPVSILVQYTGFRFELCFFLSHGQMVAAESI